MKISTTAMMTAATLGLCLTSNAMAGGGARIVVRQHYGSAAGGMVGGLDLNRIVDIGEMFLLNRFGNNTAGSSSLPPSQRAVQADPTIAAISARLDRLNAVPTPNSTLGGALPPIPTEQPSFFPK